MKIVFMGTPAFAVPVLQRLIKSYQVVAVVTQPDRPVGRKRVLTAPPVKVEAKKHGLPVIQPERVREPAELEKVLAYEPDVIVTAAFGQILPTALLEAPKYGCINVHASLLPKYRGGAPIHQAIIDGEAKTGVTIMYMVEKLDAGNILSQVEVAIEECDHVGTLHDKLSQAGADLLMETLPNIEAGTIQQQRQDETKVTFAKNITREMERIDWSRDGEQLYNQVRGLHPWPVAYTELEGQTTKIWWAEKRKASESAAPGTVIALETDGFVVATGNETALKIVELQPAGKKRMSAEQFLRGAGSFVQKGMRLGGANE